MVKWIRGANRGNRRTIERLLAGAKQTLRVFIGNAAIAANAEFENNSAAVAQLGGFGHHRVPITAHARQHALHVVTEIDAFGRR